MSLGTRIKRLVEAAAKRPCRRCGNTGVPLVLTAGDWPPLTPEMVRPCKWCGKKRDILIISTPTSRSALMDRFRIIISTPTSRSALNGTLPRGDDAASACTRSYQGNVNPSRDGE